MRLSEDEYCAEADAVRDCVKASTDAREQVASHVALRSVLVAEVVCFFRRVEKANVLVGEVLALPHTGAKELQS